MKTRRGAFSLGHGHLTEVRVAAKQRRISRKQRVRPRTGHGPVGALARLTTALAGAAAINGLHRLAWELASVAASRVQREYLLEHELDQARRARGRPLEPEETDEIERALARWEHTMELAARLRRTGSLPREEMVCLQERIAALLNEIQGYVSAPLEPIPLGQRPCELTPEQVETVLLALCLATWVPRLREQGAKLGEKYADTLGALWAAMPGDTPGLSVLGEPQKSLNTQLRVMANRLLGRPDHARMGEIKPADLILRDWENLTGTRVATWQRPMDPTNPAAENWRCAADPEGVVSTSEAVRILTQRYKFQSEQACIKFLERHGVKELPDRSY